MVLQRVRADMPSWDASFLHGSDGAVEWNFLVNLFMTAKLSMRPATKGIEY